MSEKILKNYLNSLIDKFFKILPLWENGEESLGAYMKSLQAELMGCKEFVLAINEDPLFLSMISTLQYFIDHPELEKWFIKREVFKTISCCNKLKAMYCEGYHKPSREETTEEV